MYPKKKKLQSCHSCWTYLKRMKILNTVRYIQFCCWHPAVTAVELTTKVLDPRLSILLVLSSSCHSWWTYHKGVGSQTEYPIVKLASRFHSCWTYHKFVWSQTEYHYWCWHPAVTAVDLPQRCVVPIWISYCCWHPTGAAVELTTKVCGPILDIL